MTDSQTTLLAMRGAISMMPADDRLKIVADAGEEGEAALAIVMLEESIKAEA